MRRYYILGVGADDSVGPLPPLCKGRWQKSLIFDGGVVHYGDNPPVSALR